MKRLLTIWAICFFVIILGCSRKDQKPSLKKLDFTLTCLDGQEYALSKLKGNPLIIDFWATWCSPCRAEIPHLIKLYDKYKDKGLIILAISTEDKSILDAFRKEKGINYPILLGNSEVFKQFGVSSIPHKVFIDKKGGIRKTKTGFSEDFLPVFEALVDSMVNE